MMSRNNRKQNGANPMESRQAVIVPETPPQRDPPNATCGHLLRVCVAKEPGDRVRAIDQTRRTLNILQWNTTVYNKKCSLNTSSSYRKKIDIACIQGTHLNTHHWFSVRVYHTMHLDNKWHQGFVLILIRNSLPCSGYLSIITNKQKLQELI